MESDEFGELLPVSRWYCTNVINLRNFPIGSDHAYLPVALLRRGAITAAVAGEVAVTPFHAAERSVRESGLNQRVSVRLADGLAASQRGRWRQADVGQKLPFTKSQARPRSESRVPAKSG